MGLVAYSTSVSSGQIGLESLGLEIYDDIAIPKIIGTNEENGFIR
jgi:hypothetical protein